MHLLNHLNNHFIILIIVMKKLTYLFVLAVFVTSLISCGGSATNQADVTGADAVKVKETPSKEGYNVGDVVADFELKNYDGEMVSLSGMEEVKGAILTFTCNTCPYAVAYEDRLNDLHAKYAAQGYPVVAINPNDPEVKPGDSFEAMATRVAEKKFEFAYLFDEGQKIYPKFGAKKTPEIYLLQKGADGAYTVAYTGAIDDNTKDASAVKVKYVENAIDALEKGEAPTPAFTKAIGCSIKVKKG